MFNIFKFLYINFIFFFKKILIFLYILPLLDKFSFIKKSYLRSLLSIYDLNELIDNDLIWINYKAIRFIKTFITINSQVLEYGSGASTFWFAKRCNNLTSVEHDKKYYQEVKEILKKKKIKCDYNFCEPENLSNDYKSHKIKNVTFKNYVLKGNLTKKKFDIIFIDGRCRIKCLQNSLKLIKKNGIIIFDNSNRKEYRKSILDFPLKRKTIVGLCPSLPYFSETTFFFN
tara:strand:- start:32 stop:718 length:687 start_codon:yes stop_codon:yes gene_type:complete